MRFLFLWMGWGVGCLLASGAFGAEATNAPPPATNALDSRSVLVTWTNKLGAESGLSADTNGLSAAVSNAIQQKLDAAYAAFQEGNGESARKFFEQVLVLDPKNSKARFGLSSYYIKSEQYRLALDILEAMTAEFTNDFSLKNNIAWLYATAKDNSIRNSQKAIAYAQEALLINPIDYHIWSTQSEAYFVGTQYDKARRAAEEALKIAIQRSASPDDLAEYRRQIEKCRKAARAMSIMEQ